MRSEVKTITSFGDVESAHNSEKALCAIQDALETMQVPLTHDEAGALALFLGDFPEEFDLYKDTEWAQLVGAPKDHPHRAPLLVCAHG